MVHNFKTGLQKVTMVCTFCIVLFKVVAHNTRHRHEKWVKQYKNGYSNIGIHLPFQ